MNTILNFFRRNGDHLEAWEFEVDLATREIISERPKARTTITEVDDETRRVLGILTGSIPCDSPGCVQLVNSYDEEVSRLGSDCPDCQKGAIIKKYASLIRASTSHGGV